MPTYEALHAHHILHSFSNFIPGIFQFGDTADVAALTAPRPLHLNFGAKDLTNPIEFIKPGLARIRNAYEGCGVVSNFSYFIDEVVGHTLSPKMWEHVLSVLRRYLLT